MGVGVGRLVSSTSVGDHDGISLGVEDGTDDGAGEGALVTMRTSSTEMAPHSSPLIAVEAAPSSVATVMALVAVFTLGSPTSFAELLGLTSVSVVRTLLTIA